MNSWKAFIGICYLIIAAVIAGLFLNFLKFFQQYIFLIWFFTGIIFVTLIEGIGYGIFRLVKYIKKRNKVKS